MKNLILFWMTINWSISIEYCKTIFFSPSRACAWQESQFSSSSTPENLTPTSMVADLHLWRTTMAWQYPDYPPTVTMFLAADLSDNFTVQSTPSPAAPSDLGSCSRPRHHRLHLGSWLPSLSWENVGPILTRPSLQVVVSRSTGGTGTTFAGYSTYYYSPSPLLSSTWIMLLLDDL